MMTTAGPGGGSDARGLRPDEAIVERPVHEVCGMAERAKIGSARGPRLALSCLALGLAACLHPGAASAEVVRNPIAVFAALDKVTGRISHLEVPINNTVEFGALKVTPRVCDTRPPTEQPRTASFVEVDEVKLTGEVQRIFTGWMFAESPGLHAVEHPVFDVWLTNCKTNAPPAPSGNAENAAAPDAEAPPGEAPPAEAPLADAPADAAPAEAPPAADAAAPPAEAAEPLPWAKPPPNAPSSNR
jgi:hypothetical protein